MGRNKISFEDVDQSILKWGKECKYGHRGPNGLSIRYRLGGCVACQKKMPPGEYTFEFKDIKGDLPRTKFTPEERRLLQIGHSTAWNNRNKDKVSAYQKKYDSRPEITQRRNDAYHNMAPNEKEQRLAYQRNYYRNRVAAMTPEEKQEFNRKNSTSAKIRYENKKKETE